VFRRPIGQNQGISAPAAERWMYLEAAWQMATRAAWLYDTGSRAAPKPTVQSFSARAPGMMRHAGHHDHGGFGYAKEYHVERLFREVAITRLAPITEATHPELIAKGSKTCRRVY